MKNIKLQAMIVRVAVLLFILACAATAPANLITESATTGLKSTDFNSLLSLGLFDPTLGQLNNVHITVTGELVSGAEYENIKSSSSKEGIVKYTLSQTLDVFHGAQTMLAMSDFNTKSVEVTSLPKFDGMLDYSGKSGDTTESSNDKLSKVYDYAANADLSQYIGKGTTVFTVKASAFTSLISSVPSGINFNTYSLADVTVAIRYNYAPPAHGGDNSDDHSGHHSDGESNGGGSSPAVAAVPEPNVSMMLGLGLVGIVGMKKWRQSKS